MSKHIMTCNVTGFQSENFVYNGWELGDLLGGSEVRVHVTSPVEFFNTQPDADDLMRIRKSPHFIQKAMIKRPLGYFTSGLFQDSLSFDIMPWDVSDSVDYRTHRMELSLHRIRATLFAYKLSRLETFNVTDKGRTFALRIFHPFDTLDYIYYTREVLGLREGTLVAAAPTGLEGLSVLPKSVDIWWDLQNDVMLTFDKNYAAHLYDLLSTRTSMEQLP